MMARIINDGTVDSCECLCVGALISLLFNLFSLVSVKFGWRESVRLQGAHRADQRK